jgi:nucleoside-diphosphate-sugar epimerase
VEIASQMAFQYIATHLKSQFHQPKRLCVKALVTGGNGFIGSHLVDLLIQKGYSVRCLVRKTSDLQWLSGVNVELIYGDLFDEQALGKALDGVDYVYHSAGVTKAKTSDGYFKGNAEGTRSILRSAAGASQLKRFIHVSSQAAVGPSPTKTPISEDVTPHPLTAYGRSKWKAEQECHSFMDRLPITIVRPPAVYGPRDKDIFEFFRTMDRGIQPMIGLREKYVSLIHVGDLVRGFVMAGESPAAAGQTYFVSSKDVYNWKQLGEITRKILGRRTLRIRIPEPIVYGIASGAEFFAMFSSKPALLNIEKGRDIVQNYWTCDASKAKRDFGFEEGTDIETGFRTTIDWYRMKGWLPKKETSGSRQEVSVLR